MDKTPFEFRITIVDGRPQVELHYHGFGFDGHAVHTYDDAEAAEIFEAIRPRVPPPVLEQYPLADTERPP